MVALSYGSLAAQPLQGTMQPADTPIAAAPAAQRSVSPQPARLNQSERLLLAEYQLAERVQRRVLDELKVYGAILGVALAIVGFFGFSLILDFISRRVETKLRGEIERDVGVVRNRVQATLADLQVALVEQTKVSERAQGQLSDLQARHAELQDLGGRYETLHREVAATSARVEAAVAATVETERTTRDLQNAVADSFAGRPAIFDRRFDWSPTGGQFEGSNLGGQKGTLQIRIFAQLMKRPGLVRDAVTYELPLLDVPPDYIDLWTDTKVVFRLPGEHLTHIEEFRREAEDWWQNVDPEKKLDRTFHFDYRVQTANGIVDTGEVRRGAPVVS